MSRLLEIFTNKCILQVRGVRPFLSDKYDLTSHPNYKYLSDADPKNALDIEKYLSSRLKLKLEEEFNTYEIDVSDEEELMDPMTDDDLFRLPIKQEDTV